jgi:hypothetical protein
LFFTGDIDNIVDLHFLPFYTIHQNVYNAGRPSQNETTNQQKHSNIRLISIPSRLSEGRHSLPNKLTSKQE